MDQIYGWRLHLKPQPWWQPEVTTDLTEPVLEVKVTLVEHCHAAAANVLQQASTGPGYFAGCNLRCKVRDHILQYWR